MINSRETSLNRDKSPLKSNGMRIMEGAINRELPISREDYNKPQNSPLISNVKKHSYGRID
jgi:hypothetical protein